MSRSEIIYRDFAPGADEDAAVTATGQDPLSALAVLPFGAESSIASMDGAWLLDGTREIYDGQNIAFISDVLSGADCTFSTYPVITINFDEQYTSLGISFEFDTATGNYCKELNIKWYQGSTLKSDMTFYPDSAKYYAENTVIAYDRLVITLRKTNLPYLRLRVEKILFGIARVFAMDENRSAKATLEMSLISTTLPISKLAWTMDSRKNVDFIFQKKQPIEVYNDNNLLGVYYISRHSRGSENVYSIDGEDAIGILNDTPFGGGVYTSGKSAMALVSEIINGDFEVEYDSGITDMTLKGVIKSGTKRAALQQVLFAWGVCATTDGRHSIRIRKPGTALKAIGEYHTYSGGTVTSEGMTTRVEVIAHTYTQAENGNVEINGVKYKDTQTTYSVTNPDITPSDKSNVKSVKDATLVSPDIGQATAQRVYDYYLNRNTASARILWDGEFLGDLVSVPNTWGGVTAGHLSKMDIVLSNTVAAQASVIGT